MPKQADFFRTFSNNGLSLVRIGPLNRGLTVEMQLTSQWGIYYILTQVTNISQKKFERAVLTCVGRDGSEMEVSLRRFFAR